MAMIEVQISTSPRVLDLESVGPFEITIELSLVHDAPISFPKQASTLFNGHILHAGGLTFTDVATGKSIPRNTRDLCGASCDTVLTAETEKRFVTLHPGESYTIQTGFQRIESRSTGSHSPPAIATVEQYLEHMARITTVWKWQNTHQLDDGKTYQI